LPIALGEATKTIPYLVDADKAYRFTIAWGETTASHDREGEVIDRSDVRPSPEAASEALKAFIGRIEQTPPIFSAIKVDGERAYNLARDGVAFDLAPRAVVIHTAEVVDAPDADHLEIEIACGKGVYVRALARDLALRLGACGHVCRLTRARVGAFRLGQAISLEKLESLCHTGRGLEILSPVETALDDIPALAVTTEDAFKLSQGRPIVLLPRQVETLRTRLASPDGDGLASRTVLANAGGAPVALCEMRAGQLNPTRVFNL
jgi:tRNA pseudouridine55 synthase